MHNELIARIESGEGDERELEAEVARLVGQPHGPKKIVDYESRSVTYIEEQAPRYMSSVDAALTLLPPNVRKSVQQRRSYEPIWFAFYRDGDTKCNSGKAPTLARAITAACLRAGEG